MENRNAEVRFETFDKPTSNKFLEELKAKQKKIVRIKQIAQQKAVKD